MIFSNQIRRCLPVLSKNRCATNRVDRALLLENHSGTSRQRKAADSIFSLFLAALLFFTLTFCKDSSMANEIYAVKQQNEARLMSLPGVVSVGIGQDPNGEPAIVVGLEAAAPATVQQVPEKISGYPVIIQTVGPIKAQ